MKKKITFEIKLDENTLPEKIKMSSSDTNEDIEKIKSLMILMWESKSKNSLNINLWTKDMPLNDMYIFYHQIFLTMSNNLHRATNNTKASAAINDFSKKFADLTGILNRK